MLEGGTGMGRRSARATVRVSWVIAALAVLSLAFAPGALGANQHATSALAQSHAYRHGVVPRLTPNGNAGLATSGGNLTYGGGNFNVGVTTGAPRVYVIFWGSQWGAQST